MFLNLKYLYWTLNCPTTQSNLQIQWYPYQNCNDSFHRNEISILKFVWNHCVVLSRSVVYNSLRTHASQLTRLPSPWRFSRKKYWSGLPCPPPGDLPNPGIKPRSPALQADSLQSEPPGKTPKPPLNREQSVVPSSATRGSHRQNLLEMDAVMGTEPQDRGLALQSSLCAVEGIAVLFHRPSQGSGCSAQGQAPPGEDVAPLSGCFRDSPAGAESPSSSILNGGSALCTQPTSPEVQVLI